MNKIEQEIWDYLDGNLGEDEKLLLESRIEKDPLYRSAFAELNDLNASLATLQLDEPSMGFNRNVMDKVALEPAPGFVRSLIDKRVIYGISAFFILTIGGLLLFLFTTIDWRSIAEAANSTIIIPEIDYSALMNTTLIKAFVFIDVMLGLLLFDGFLRKAVNTKKLKKI